MNGDDVERALVDEVVHDLDEAVRLLWRWRFAVSAALQLNVLGAALLHRGTIVKPLGVGQIHPEAQLQLQMRMGEWGTGLEQNSIATLSVLQ